jgi:hypothetical protein
MGTLAISQLSSQSTVNRWREVKSREPAEFMSPSHEREYSLLGEHCSVVRLNEGSILYALRGWITRNREGTRVRLGERLQPSGFA